MTDPLAERIARWLPSDVLVRGEDGKVRSLRFQLAIVVRAFLAERVTEDAIITVIHEDAWRPHRAARAVLALLQREMGQPTTGGA